MSHPVVLVDAGDGPGWARSLASLRDHLPAGAELVELGARTPPAAAEAAAPADVVLVDAPVVVGAGWLERLRAEADATVATVSPLILDGRGDAPPALRHDRGGPGPRLASEPWGCRLVTRAALQLAGPLDHGFAARASARGLVHAVAPAALAVLPGAPEPPRDPEDRLGRHTRPPGPLDRARLRGRRALDGLWLTIDGRALVGTMAGTQAHTLQLIRALHATGEARMRVYMPPDPGDEAVATLEAMPDIELMDADRGPGAFVPSHVVHRPYQPTSPNDLLVLPQIGRRVVITHQDSILFHAPSYHRDEEAWGAYRRLTGEALAAADMTLVFSEHAGRELVAEDLAERDRLRVVPLGTDHAAASDAPRAPAGAEGPPFLLCIGTDLRHKNRPFAIELVAAMRERGWDGRLVLAGGHLPDGGSAAEERALLAGRPELAIDLGVVSEAGKAWLYEHAEAVVYPTLVEGFGFIPFEAAAAGTPALFAAQASLAEFLGPDAAMVVPWDAAASAERALALLHDPAAVAAQVQAVRAAGAQLTWERTARRLLEIYDEVLSMPATPGAAAAWRALEAEDARGALDGRYWALRQEVGDTGLALVGDSGALPDDVQRALAALTRRKATREPLFATLRALQRLASRGRR